jgi:hypothetical protein
MRQWRRGRPLRFVPATRDDETSGLLLSLAIFAAVQESLFGT